jgi:uncharacterized integral membrane protein
MTRPASAMSQPRKRKRRPIIRWIIIATILLPILVGLFHAADVSYAYVFGFAFGITAPMAILAILAVMLTRWIAAK